MSWLQSENRWITLLPGNVRYIKALLMDYLNKNGWVFHNLPYISPVSVHSLTNPLYCTVLSFQPLIQWAAVTKEITTNIRKTVHTSLIVQVDAPWMIMHLLHDRKCLSRSSFSEQRGTIWIDKLVTTTNLYNSDTLVTLYLVFHSLWKFKHLSSLSLPLWLVCFHSS